MPDAETPERRAARLDVEKLPAAKSAATLLQRSTANPARPQIVSLTKRAVHWIYELDDSSEETPVDKMQLVGIDHGERPTPEGMREMYRTADADELASYVEEVLMEAAKKGGHGIGAISSLRSIVRQARR